MEVGAGDWVDQTFPYYELIRTLNFYLDMECWIICLDRREPWSPIRYHNRETWPVELDDLFGRREARVKYNRQQIQRTMSGPGTICSAFDGFYSFFTPILQNGKAIGVFQMGPFLKAVPGEAELTKRWKKLSRTEVPRFDVDFFRYVRTHLDTPVVEGPVYKALRTLLELFASVAARETDPRKASTEALRMKREIFSRHLPNQFWFKKIVKNNRVYPADLWVDRVRSDQWRKQEQGIDRRPTTVLAVMPDEDALAPETDLKILLRNHRFQQVLFGLAKRFPQTISAPLEDYGMAFFTSAEPGVSEVKAKLEILDRIDGLSKLIYASLGVRVLIGVSRCLGREENLSRVCREAVVALEFCRPLSRPILFYEDIHHNPSVPRPPFFYDLSKKLVEIYLRGAVQEIEPVRSRYLEQALAHSAGRPETARLHFLFVCGQLIDGLSRKKPLGGQDFSALFVSLEKKLRETADMMDLVETFRGALRQLLELNLRPNSGSRSIQIEAARRYVDENFMEDLKVEEVARRHGFSISVFSREFKHGTGQGFAVYLKKVRVKHARHLLVSTSLSISQVGHAAGFNNPQYFFDVYKRETGQTPGETRTQPRAVK